MYSWFVCKYCAIAIDKNRMQGHYFSHGLGAPRFDHFQAEEKQPFDIVVRIPPRKE